MIPDIKELTELHTSRKRDEFACAAMAAIVQRDDTTKVALYGNELLAKIAQLSYRIADAMLAERAK